MRGMIRLSRRTTLTEWQIQHKLQRFKLHQIQELLDGDGWSWSFGNAKDQLNALENILRAGVKQSRHVMNGLQMQSPCDAFVSEIVESARRREEKDVSYRQEYAQKFYGVKP